MKKMVHLLEEKIEGDEAKAQVRHDIVQKVRAAPDMNGEEMKRVMLAVLHQYETHRKAWFFRQASSNLSFDQV